MIHIYCFCKLLTDHTLYIIYYYDVKMHFILPVRHCTVFLEQNVCTTVTIHLFVVYCTEKCTIKSLISVKADLLNAVKH